MSSNIPFRIRRTVGIDLGNTSSVIAMLDETGSVLLTGHDFPSSSDTPSLTYPSCLAWDDQRKKIIAGHEARSLLAPACERVLDAPVVSHIKQQLGLDQRISIGPKSLSPQGALAVILAGLREWMMRTLPTANFFVDQAVLTMPAEFDSAQRSALLKAGELAGFRVVELLPEPAAAVIYYAWLREHGDGNYLVYHLGGGTFSASVVSRRQGEVEVIANVRDVLLGGADIDQLLVTHLLQAGQWKWNDGQDCTDPLFDHDQPQGAVAAARLRHLAEEIKIELSRGHEVKKSWAKVLPRADGRWLSLEVHLTRATFEGLIRATIAKTIERVHEALRLAEERDPAKAKIDHVILVGGNTRIPLVGQMLTESLGKDPLSHEPELCVGYGAALRGANQGTHYVWSPAQDTAKPSRELDLHITSPRRTRETKYALTGSVRLLEKNESEEPAPLAALLAGASVRIRNQSTRLIEEVFLDGEAAFEQGNDLEPETDNLFEIIVCDADGRDQFGVGYRVRHQSQSRPLIKTTAATPTQVVTRALSIEVLSRGRQRTKQILAPIGAPLPSRFRTTCRTTDQSGRVVVPLFEENRVIKQLIVEALDPSLPIGSPVEVELAIDHKHTIEVAVRVREAMRGERCETARIEPPPEPKIPSESEIAEMQSQMNAQLLHLGARLRGRLQTRFDQLLEELRESITFNNDAKAIDLAKEMRQLVSKADIARGQTLDPPWSRFVQLVRDCMGLAAQVADRTDQEREKLFAPIQEQEGLAEQAYEDSNQIAYAECRENLENYGRYLQKVLFEVMPTAPANRSPEDAAKQAVEEFRGQLSLVWKKAREKQRAELEPRLQEIAKQASGFSARIKNDPREVVRDADRLSVEVQKIHEMVDPSVRKQTGEPTGLLEGSA
jgi:molecular chaperone DnaK